MDNSLQKRNNFLTTFLSFEWKDRPKTQPSLLGGGEHPPMASSGQSLFWPHAMEKQKEIMSGSIYLFFITVIYVP